MNEAETRAEHIDPALKAAGWGVVEGSKILREYPITPGRIEGLGRRGKPLTADYVLVYRTRKLAVVEAKAWDEPLTEGVGQAKNYAGKMAIRFTYASNGQGIFGVDMKTGKEGERSRYPTPDQLWAMTFSEANAWRHRFAAVPFEDKGGTLGERYFRDIAIQRVLDAIAADKPRILLTLATGTGKTLIAFQIAWKLFHSRWNLSREPSRRPRILFLADRNILADQAYNAFSAFPEDALVRIAPEDIRKKGRVPTNGSLFFTIFQTFMSGPPKDGKPSPYFGDYPTDFFHFIVIDECHRGGANDESNWRGILDYFAPAVQLGWGTDRARTQGASARATAAGATTSAGAGPQSASAEDQDHTRRRQGAHHPAHDGDDLLAPGRDTDVRAAVHGTAVRQAAGLFQERRGTPRLVERAGHPEEASAGSGRQGLWR
jgi:type I restriction enzyme R subunit